MPDKNVSHYSDDEPPHEEVASSGLKLESAERIFRLLQLLLANECTRRDVFEHLALYYKLDRAILEQDIPRRADKMFERDIGFLKDQGFEIQTIRKRSQPTRYHLVKGSGPQATFLFTSQEVDGLALLYNLFADPSQYASHDLSQPLPQQPSRHPFAEDMLSLLEKMALTLPAEQKKQFDRWVHKPYLYFNLSTVADYLPHRSTIDTIIHAISVRQQILFEYLPSHRKQNVISHENIDPCLR